MSVELNEYVIVVPSDSKTGYVVPTSLLTTIAAGPAQIVSQEELSSFVDSVTVPELYADAKILEDEEIGVVVAEDTEEELLSLLVAKDPYFYLAFEYAEDMTKASAEEWLRKFNELPGPEVIEGTQADLASHGYRNRDVYIANISYCEDIPSDLELELTSALCQLIPDATSPELTRYCVLPLLSSIKPSFRESKLCRSVTDWKTLQAMEHSMASESDRTNSPFQDSFLVDLRDTKHLQYLKLDTPQTIRWDLLDHYAGFPLADLDLSRAWLTGPIMLTTTSTRVDSAFIDQWMQSFYTKLYDPKRTRAVVKGITKSTKLTLVKSWPTYTVYKKFLPTEVPKNEVDQYSFSFSSEQGFGLTIVIDNTLSPEEIEETKRQILEVVRQSYPEADLDEDGISPTFRRIRLIVGTKEMALRNTYSSDRGWITGNGDERTAVVTPSCLLGSKADGSMYAWDQTTMEITRLYKSIGVPVRGRWSGIRKVGKPTISDPINIVAELGWLEEYARLSPSQPVNVLIEEDD